MYRYFLFIYKKNIGEAMKLDSTPSYGVARLHSHCPNLSLPSGEDCSFVLCINHALLVHTTFRRRPSLITRTTLRR